MTLKVKVYGKVKYEIGSQMVHEAIFTAVKDFEVKILEDAEVYEMGFDCVDEFKEYFIISFEDGTSTTFRNSHIDVFKMN